MILVALGLAAPGSSLGTRPPVPSLGAQVKVELFDYELPQELIAQEPLPERSASRMLVVRRSPPGWEHSFFRALPAYLRPGDCVVLNDTRVLPARLEGRRPTGGRVELLLVRRCGPRRWQCLVRPARRVPVGEEVELGEGVRARVVGQGPEGIRELEFICSGSLEAALERLGRVPLPPYIRRLPRPADRERYQTVYARVPGAIAAPTAGLHFDEDMLRLLQQRGIELVFITLHVGLGTFRPLTATHVEQHHMHAEAYQITPAAAEKINQSRARGGRVVAVGTSVVRTLETVADAEGHVRAGEGETDLFIYPGYRWRVIDGLLTNFHLPRSAPLLMVAALVGRALLLEAYQEAVRQRYRFYSYGDCMLIL
jgi:S-adenosylmethionine:tRNA ribosyltransferase-isomerase